MYIHMLTYLHSLVYVWNGEGPWVLFCYRHRFEGLRFKQWRFCPCIWMMMCSSRRGHRWKDAWTHETRITLNGMRMEKEWNMNGQDWIGMEYQWNIDGVPFGRVVQQCDKSHDVLPGLSWFTATGKGSCPAGCHEPAGGRGNGDWAPLWSFVPHAQITGAIQQPRTWHIA